jgi:hypothetical protein
MTGPRPTPSAIPGIALAVLLVVTGAYYAGVTVVDDTGHVLTVDVIYDSSDPSVQGLAVEDQAPTGTTTTSTIFSTWDPVIDTNPDISLNPRDGQPVVIWSRQQGSDFEIAMVRRMPGGWGPIDILTYNSSNDIEPRAIVDPIEAAHVVWYPSGLGGPVYLQSFDIHNGQALTPPAKPLEPPGTKTLKTGTTGGSSVGGGDDPGLIGGLTSRASENPCVDNPSAAPEHGALLACGRPAAYQLISCYLTVGVYDTANAVWAQSITNLTLRDLSTTTVREIAQSMASARCN